MKKLREELVTLRVRIRSLDAIRADSLNDEVIEVENQWEVAMKELEKSFNKGHWSIALRRFLKFGNAREPHAQGPGARGSSMTTLLGLLTEPILGYFRREPVAEVIRLRKGLPGPNRLIKAILKLFGTVGSN
jgi:hypothetical protein